MFRFVVDGVGDYWIFKGHMSLGAASTIDVLFDESTATLARFEDSSYMRGQATWHDANSKWPQLKTLIEAESFEELEKLIRLEEMLGTF